MPSGVFARSFRYIIPTTLLRPHLACWNLSSFWIFWVEEDSRHWTLWFSVMIESGGKHWLVLREQRNGGKFARGKCARAKFNSLVSSRFACLRRKSSPWRFTYSHLNCRRVACSSKSSEDEDIAGSLHAERFTRVTAHFKAHLCLFQFTCTCQKPVIAARLNTHTL